MRSAMERGKWVFFQNCHLAPSWMPTLERLIEQIDPDKVRERTCRILHAIVSMYKYQMLPIDCSKNYLMRDLSCFQLIFVLLCPTKKPGANVLLLLNSVSLLIVYFILISRDR